MRSPATSQVLLELLADMRCEIIERVQPVLRLDASSEHAVHKQRGGTENKGAFGALGQRSGKSNGARSGYLHIFVGRITGEHGWFGHCVFLPSRKRGQSEDQPPRHAIPKPRGLVFGLAPLSRR